MIYVLFLNYIWAFLSVLPGIMIHRLLSNMEISYDSVKRLVSVCLANQGRK